MTLQHLLWESPAAGTARDCLGDETRMLSYEAVETLSQAFAEQLTERGIIAGDVVGVLLDSGIEFVIGVLASWLVGAVAAPLDPATSEHELYFQIGDAEAKILLTDDAARAAVLGSGLPVVLTREMRQRALGAPRHPQTPAAQFALRSYASAGEMMDFTRTRRLPEGVLLDHAHLNALAATTAERAGLEQGSREVVDRPWTGIPELCAAWLAPLTVGGSTVFARRSPIHPDLADVLRPYPAGGMSPPEERLRRAPLARASRQVVGV